jgi:HPt (histidine-containing phosphotransfer) domain-containing protein
MPDFNHALFAVGMIELKAKFVTGLPERMKIIEQSRQMPAAIWQPDDEILNELHRLAGASGSLGFEQLATAARQLEQRLQSLEGGAPFSVQDYEMLEQAAAVVMAD